MKLLIQLFESDRDPAGDKDRDLAGRRDEFHPSVLVSIDFSPNSFAESGLVAGDLCVGGAAVADDQRHDASVAKPWDAA